MEGADGPPASGGRSRAILEIAHRGRCCLRGVLAPRNPASIRPGHDAVTTDLEESQREGFWRARRGNPSRRRDGWRHDTAASPLAVPRKLGLANAYVETGVARCVRTQSAGLPRRFPLKAQSHRAL